MYSTLSLSSDQCAEHRRYSIGTIFSDFSANRSLDTYSLKYGCPHAVQGFAVSRYLTRCSGILRCSPAELSCVTATRAQISKRLGGSCFKDWVCDNGQFENDMLRRYGNCIISAGRFRSCELWDTQSAARFTRPPICTGKQSSWLADAFSVRSFFKWPMKGVNSRILLWDTSKSVSRARWHIVSGISVRRLWATLSSWSCCSEPIASGRHVNELWDLYKCKIFVKKGFLPKTWICHHHHCCCCCCSFQGSLLIRCPAARTPVCHSCTILWLYLQIQFLEHRK